jgi:hypothetical protein
MKKQTVIKSTSTLLLIIMLSLSAILISNRSLAQSAVPPEVASIVSMNLTDGQAKLKSLGYEICSSSMTGKKQDWFNESARICVTVKFGKNNNEITEVTMNNAISECEKRLAESRKVLDRYHDGQAPMHEVKIDEERKKLAEGGFKASYWINDVSPGRNSEYWVNESTQKCMYIVWEIQGNKWVMTESSKYEMGKNPYPKK